MMWMTNWFRWVALAACLVAGVTGNAVANDRPNILFLFADDQCYETIRALGHVDIDTPNLDRLVTRGTTFTHAYNMGSWSGAVCIASRTMLVTGRTVWRAQETERNMAAEVAARNLWPQMMKDAGYRTYFTGKWHVKADVQKLFDVARHVRAGMPKDTPEGYNRPLPGQPDPWDPADPKFGGFWEGGRHWSEVGADDAVDYLKDSERGDAPFFMYIAFNAPHDPRQSPQEYLDRYPLSRIPVPANYQALYPFKDAIGCGPGLRDEKLAPFPRTEHAIQVHRREYYALITHLDAQIGRILDALEATGQAGKTWIFYTADHGLAVGHHGLLGKQNMYDHSLRVPFLVAGPGVEAGTQIDTPIYLQSVMATSLELANARRPEHVEFASLLPLLHGHGSEGDGVRPVYGGYLALQRALIDDGYKLIVYPQAERVRLYQLREDPGEQRDLAGDAAQRPRIARMLRQLQAEQERLDDSLDLSAIVAAWN